MPLRPALLDRHIPALAVTGLGETLTKCTAEREPNLGWARAVKDTDHRHAPDCARAASGQATAAPPRRVMKSRRLLIRSHRRRGPGAWEALRAQAPWRS